MGKNLGLELLVIMGIAVVLCVVFSRVDFDRIEDPARKTTIASSSETPASSESSDVNASVETPEETTAEPTTAAPAFPIPSKMYQDAGVETDSDAFCVLDEDGNIVIAKNEEAAYAPASITKVLTALVVLEHASLSDMVVVREEDIQSVDIMSSGVYPSLKSGEVISVENLLYALILPSTNAAGAVLASHVAGDRESFAGLMNQKLTELGLCRSHFVNAHGLDQDGHYVSAYDMCVILKAACADPDLRKILGTRTYTIPATEFTEERSIVMGHKMVTGEDYLDGTFAGKPGGSPAAGNSLVTAVERNGRTLYFCTLHSDSGKQYEDTRNIVEKAFSLLEGRSFTAGGVVHDLYIDWTSGTEVMVSFAVDNDPASVTCRVFNVADNGENAVCKDVPLSGPGRYMAEFSLPSCGTYEIQVYLTDSKGQMTAISDRFLLTGETLAPGLLTWNGETYCVKENGFVYIGAAEAPSGCYYANGYGILQKGFVGGRFFAGDDYSIVTGWFTSDHETYYAGADGRIVTGKAMIGGQVYEFRDYGSLIRQ